jgi:glycosyltransferase involved in cell wall biosynthesis
MRILHVTQTIYPYIIGGEPIQCHETSNLQSKNNQVTVLTVKRGHKIEDVHCNYILKQFRWLKMPWDFFGMENPICPGLWWELLRSDYDVLHAHSQLFFTTFFSIILNKIKNKPSIITVHGIKAVRDKTTNLFQEIWLQVLARYIFKITDKVQCMTEKDAKEIQRYGVNNNKIVIIPNGIDTTLFKPSNPDNKHNDFILWIGRFVEEKGLKYLVEAMEFVTKDYPNKKVILVGEGPLKEDIQCQIHNKDLDKIFEIRNNCSQKEIATLMKKCELFILPSLKEGFPKSILEAMASGKPIITTNGLKDVVGNAGITVTPESTEELKNAIIFYLSNPSEEKKSGTRGRKYIEENYSWDIVNKKIEEVYTSLAQGNKCQI